MSPSRPNRTAKNAKGEFSAFENLLRQVVSVPHSKIKEELDAEKQRKTNRASASKSRETQRTTKPN